MMANLDERIKRELEDETAEIDKMMARDGGLPDMVSAAFKGNLRRWVWVTSIIILPLTGLLLWCGYEFFTAVRTDDRVFWGFCTLLSAMPQIALKQWQWMEMNRASMMREIKRIEIAVAEVSGSAIK